MQLNIIRYVVTISETGSFTRAAEQLYISQPALSQAVQRLEKELGAVLFRREKGRIAITPAGEVLVEEGKKMLESENTILDRLAELNHLGAGRLVIGAAPSYQRFYLSHVISVFRKKYPHIQLILQEGYTKGMMESVLSGNIDIALLCEPVPPGIDCLPVFQEEVFLAVPPNHRLTQVFPKKGNPYPMGDLSLCRDEPFIVYRPGRRITDVIFAETKQAGFYPNIATECDSTESANIMVRHGMGISLIPSVTVDLCPREQQACYYRLRPEGLMRHFVLGRKSGGFSSRAQQEFFFVAEHLNEFE
ncbi:MAG: LysR family transcriptional regulator [Pseudoflavonifractor sp.]|nr:LysR family transcriptional regulator [Pseudoflavonifractor sp.]